MPRAYTGWWTRFWVGCWGGLDDELFGSAGVVYLARRICPLMLELSTVYTGPTFVIFVCYGLCAASVRDHVISRPRVMAWLRRTFAAAFVVLGAKLAFAER